MSKDIQEEIKKGYEFTIAGFKLKLTNTVLAVAVPVITTIGGAAWGVFEFVKDYQDMRQKIQKYVSPDLTELYKKLELVQQSSEKGTQYTQDIKNDLKQDIRRLEGVVENVERSSRQSARETSIELKSVQKEVGDTVKHSEQTMRQVQADLDKELRNVRKEVDSKIQKAMDNPLAK